MTSGESGPLSLLFKEGAMKQSLALIVLLLFIAGITLIVSAQMGN